MLSPARRSRLGVSAPFAPRKPMRSTRTESRVISTRLGFEAAAAEEIQNRTRLRLARTFLIIPVVILEIVSVIMPVSVKVGHAMIKKPKSKEKKPEVWTCEKQLTHS